MTQGQTLPARGWTLVELLVAMTLSLLVIAGIGQIYLAAKRSYDIQTNLAQIQDVGRYVTHVLTRDIQMAGYWDLMNIDEANSTSTNDPDVTSPPTPPDNLFLTGDVLPGGCPGTNATDWGKMVTEGIFGFNDNDPAGVASPRTYSCISSWLRGDTLVVRYADPAVVNPGAITSTRLYIRTAPSQGIVAAGDPQTIADTYSSTLLDPIYTDHALVAHAYYVATPIATACGNVPVFAREDLLSNGTPQKESLINGVEHLQFQYGIDNDSDDSVEQYLNADEITNVSLWQKVRSVHYWVLVRAYCPESGYTDTNTYSLGDTSYTPNDHYRRSLYSATVALQNWRGH